MELTKRGRKAVKALLRGERVDFTGWPADEVLAVLDAALAEATRLREWGRRQLAEMEAELEKARAAAREIDESIDRLLEARAQVVKVAQAP